MQRMQTRHPLQHPKKIYGAEWAAQQRDVASEFLDAARVARDCVIFTVVPNSEIDANAYALELGRLLGVRVILPQVSGLRTIDHSHLTATSAERWSQAFLDQAGSTIERCAATPAAAGK